MFTGIVAEQGEVISVTQLGPDQVRVAVSAHKVIADAGLGDSIAVNGVCLTIAQLGPGSFAADVMAETMRRSTLGALHVSDSVNLETAATPTTHLGGHIVQGHVDGTGTVIKRNPTGDFDEIDIAIPAPLARYIVEKGSITVQGVSLTVVGVDCTDDSHWLRVALIPTTLTHTTLGQLSPGDSVNLEVDVIAKYVERLLKIGEQ